MEWTEITRNNVDEVYKYFDDGYPIIIAHIERNFDETLGIIEETITYQMNHSLSFNGMAKYGEYYYIILPKLK